MSKLPQKANWLLVFSPGLARLALVIALADPAFFAQAALSDQMADTRGATHASPAGAYCCNDHWLCVRADYLFWWTRGSQLPPLVTTSPTGTDISDAGVLGEPGTEVLFGDELTSSGPRSGLRVIASARLDSSGEWWLATDWLFLNSWGDQFHAFSEGERVLARPFFDEAIGLPNSELISFPGYLAGGVSVDASSDVWGAGAALERNLTCCAWDDDAGGYRLDLLAGYRFLQLSDSVEIYEQLMTIDPLGPLLVGTGFSVADVFRSQSDFHGFELGLRGELVRNRYFLAGEARAALGCSFHRLHINGNTTVSVPGLEPIRYAGGLLAHDAAWGRHTDREFAVVPQAELRVGRYFSNRLRCSIGYCFLYWSQVVRAGEQIDPSLNSNQLPAPGGSPSSSSAISLHSSSFWAQGLTAALEWEY